MPNFVQKVQSPQRLLPKFQQQLNRKGIWHAVNKNIKFSESCTIDSTSGVQVFQKCPSLPLATRDMEIVVALLITCIVIENVFWLRDQNSFYKMKSGHLELNKFTDQTL